MSRWKALQLLADSSHAFTHVRVCVPSHALRLWSFSREMWKIVNTLSIAFRITEEVAKNNTY